MRKTACSIPFHKYKLDGIAVWQLTFTALVVYPLLPM